MRFSILLIFLSSLGITVGILGLDILSNTSSELGVFLAGVLLEALLAAICLSKGWSNTSRLIMICFMSGVWGASLAFFSYIKALPGRFALQYLFAEPLDSWNLALSYFRPSFALGWAGATVLLYVLTGAVVRKTSDSGKKSHIFYISAAIVLMFGITLNGFRTNPGKGSPGLDFCYSLFRSLYETSTSPKNNLIRLQPRIHLTAMQPLTKTMPFNVLVIVHESLRSDRMSVYGYPEDTTPKLDRWLHDLQDESHNVFRFRNAYSNATYTHLSYPSILSGVHPLEGVEALHTRPLLFDHLKRLNGIKTAIISSHSYESGNYAAFLRSASIDRLAYRESEGWKAWNNLGADDAHLPGAFSGFLDGIGLQNFFVILHHNGSHFPYKTNDDRPSDDLASRYDQSVRYVDSITNRVFAELAQRDLLDRTLIVITSDHGESFGENGTNGHFGPIHPSNAKIPFIWLIPKRFEMPTAALNQNLDKAVSNLDIVPTVLGMLGMPDKRLLGRDLQRDLLHAEDDVVIYNLGTGQEKLNFAVVSKARFDSYSYSADSGRLMRYQLLPEKEANAFVQSGWLEIPCKPSNGFSINLLRSCPIPTKSNL